MVLLHKWHIKSTNRKTDSVFNVGSVFPSATFNRSVALFALIYSELYSSGRDNERLQSNFNVIGADCLGEHARESKCIFGPVTKGISSSLTSNAICDVHISSCTQFNATAHSLGVPTKHTLSDVQTQQAVLFTELFLLILIYGRR